MVLFAALAALHISIFISITAENVHSLNARFAILFRRCTNGIFLSQNISARTATMPCIFGNKTKTALFTNAITTNALYIFQKQINLTLGNDCFALLNLHSLSCATSTANTISLTNSLPILHRNHIQI